MDPILGEIMIFAGNFQPRGWMFCHGQLLAISQYSALFSILGTTYGGDGRTTFALPDLRGRAPIGFGHGPGLSDYRLGQKGGREQVTLTVSNMPNYNLAVNATVSGTIDINLNEEDPSATEGNGAILGNTDSPVIYNNEAVDPATKLGGVSHNLTVSGSAHSNGGNIPFDIRNPYIAMNYIIAVQGIFPSRG